MAKIVIIGNSAAGFSCCSNLLNKSRDNEITIISRENYPAYKRNLLIDYLSDTIKEEELFLAGEDFYKQNNLSLLKNSKVSAVDTKKQRVVLKDNTKVNYDYLVIASGQKIDLPDIPGKTKEGIFVVYDLEDIKNIKQRLMISDTVCIIGEPRICLRLLEAMAKKNKEFKVVSKPRPESALPQDKIEWIDGCELVELIGEGAELRALKLSNGKAIGTSLVLFAGIYSPCGEFLKDSGIKTGQNYILVNDGMQTNFENVFACGAIARNEKFLDKEKSWEDAVNEGALAADSLIKSMERMKMLCQKIS